MIQQVQSNLKNLSIINNIWPNIFLLAEANHELFTELIVLTSNSYRREKAAEKAFLKGATINNIDTEIERIYNSIPIEEFVEVFKDNILAVLNVPNINDNVVNKVLILVSQITDFKIGKRIDIHDIIS